MAHYQTRVSAVSDPQWRLDPAEGDAVVQPATDEELDAQTLVPLQQATPVYQRETALERIAAAISP